MTTSLLPKLNDLIQLLEGLLGKTVKAEPTTTATTPMWGMVATYIDDEGRLEAMFLVDLRFACSAGAALSMVPPLTAEEAIATGKLDENLAENLYEVLNVASAWLNIPGRPHTKIRDTCSDGFPEDVLEAINAPGHTIHLDIHIEDYPDGSFSVIFV